MATWVLWFDWGIRFKVLKQKLELERANEWYLRSYLPINPYRLLILRKNDAILHVFVARKMINKSMSIANRKYSVPHSPYRTILLIFIPSSQRIAKSNPIATREQ